MSEDRRDFWIEAFSSLVQVWPFMTPTPERIRVYDSALQNYSVADLRRGVAWVIGRSTDRQAPPPGAIRKGILEARERAATGGPLPQLPPPTAARLLSR